MKAKVPNNRATTIKMTRMPTPTYDELVSTDAAMGISVQVTAFSFHSVPSRQEQTPSAIRMLSLGSRMSQSSMQLSLVVFQ